MAGFRALKSPKEFSVFLVMSGATSSPGAVQLNKELISQVSSIVCIADQQLSML